MIKKLAFIGLLVITMMVFVSTESNAGCIDLGGGGLFCAEWIPGSEICMGKVTGFNDCIKNSTCQVLCAAGGTIQEDGTPSGACNNNQPNFPLLADNCFVTGTGTCTSPGGNFNDPDPNTGEPFLVEGPIAGAVNVHQCDKKGRCNFENELQPSSAGACPNKNWTLDFTAHEFKALACACERGIYEQPLDARGLPHCNGVETCQLQRCTLTGSTYTCTAAVGFER